MILLPILLHHVAPYIQYSLSVLLDLSVENDCPEPGGGSSPTGEHLGKASLEVNERSLSLGPCSRAEGQAENCPPPGPSEHWLNRGGESVIGANVVRAHERFPCGGRRSGH